MALSELHVALIVAGGFAVLGVWAYNQWQLRRVKKEHTHQGNGVSPSETKPPAEPTLASLPGEADSGREVRAQGERGASRPPIPSEWGNEAFDCEARLRLRTPLALSTLLAALEASFAHLSRPMQWFAWDLTAGHWALLNENSPGLAGLTDELVVTLQLADRRGPLDAGAFAEWENALRELARRYAGELLLPDAEKTLAHARRLDEFCGVVDVQLGLRVVPEDPAAGFAAEHVRAWIVSAGLHAEGGRFIASDDTGAERYVVVCSDAQGQALDARLSSPVAALSFALDVPRSAHGAADFDAMLAEAQRAAARLSGRLLDAHGRALPESTIAAIRARIVELQSRMSAYGIEPGSLRALRLFS
ncbi:MAG: hypothetical protein N2441_00355 [Rhodocyclaceae bacterium]|nr:hypothetical protein [Rhodocyclaceae bacterium]